MPTPHHGDVVGGCIVYYTILYTLMPAVFGKIAVEPRASGGLRMLPGFESARARARARPRPRPRPIRSIRNHLV